MKSTQPNNRPPQRGGQLSGDERIINRTAQRRKRNRRRALIIRFVFCFLILMVAIVLSLFLFFKIETVTVTGNNRYTADEIIAAAEVNIGENLIFKGESAASEKVASALPYIDSVKFKRRLPNTLEIQVTNTEAYYAIPDAGTYILLNPDCKVLENGVEMIGENVILLNAGEIVSAQAGAYLETANRDTAEKLKQIRLGCESCGLNGITLIDTADIYNINLVYQGRITLELGETGASVLNKKLALGKAAIDRQNEENELYRGTINLTVEGTGYWAEETASTTAPATEPPPESTAEGESVTQNSESSTKKPKSG